MWCSQTEATGQAATGRAVDQDRKGGRDGMGNGRLSGRAAGGSSGSQLGAGTCEHAQAQRTEARRQRVERSIGHGAGSSELGACIRPHLTQPSPLPQGAERGAGGGLRRGPAPELPNGNLRSHVAQNGTLPYCGLAVGSDPLDPLAVLNSGVSSLRICFGFRASDFKPLEVSAPPRIGRGPQAHVQAPAARNPLPSTGRGPG